MPYFQNVSVFDRTIEEWKYLLYDDREICSSDPPFVYNLFNSLAHLLATPIYLIASFTLFMERSDYFKIYKKYLAFHTISNFLFEFHLTLIMRPVFFLPTIITRFVGIFFFRYINGGILLYIFVIFIGFTFWSILELFFYRFKIITDKSYNEEWIKKSFHFVSYFRLFLIIMSFFSFVSMLMLTGGLFDQEMFKNDLEIIKIHPELACQSALTIPRYFPTGLKPIHVFNSILLLIFILGTFQTWICGGISLISLKNIIAKATISTKTFQMQRMFLYSLFAQLLVHFIFLFLPLLIYIFAILYDIDANVTAYIAIVIVSLHGVMSTLAMVFLNKPLREVFLQIFIRVFTPNIVHVSTTSQT